jgi:hypothetical protein
MIYQSLLISVVIGAELNLLERIRFDLHNCNREELEPLDDRTDPESDSTGGKNKK